MILSKIKLIIGLFAAVALLAFSTTSVWAGETEWRVKEGMAKARLIFASEDLASEDLASEDGLLAALEIELAPDWKTYWRSPGEAGLPPGVSLNGEDLALLYPLPKPIVFYGIKTFGYADLVAIPFRIPREALEKGGDFNVFYMVCKDICVPVEESFSLTANDITTGSPLQDIALSAWLKKVPPAEEGAGLAYEAARIVGRVNHQRLILDSQIPDGEEAKILIVEADGFVMGDVIKHHKSIRNVRYVVPMKPQIKDTDLMDKDVQVTLAVSPSIALDQTVLSGNKN